MDSQFAFILFLALVTTFLLLSVHRKKNKNKDGRRLPAGPRKLPVVGNLHLLRDLPHRAFERLSQEYGPLMYLQLGSVPTVVVSSADMAREIFKTHDLVFSGRPVLYAAKKLSYECSTVSFAPYGEYWRQARKIMIMELLTVRRVESFRGVREEEVAFMVDRIRIARSASVPINLSEMMLSLVNNITCRVAFGKKFEDRGDDGGSNIREVLAETQYLLGAFNVADFFPWMGWINRLNGLETRLENNFLQLDQFYDEVIQEHINGKRSESNQQEDLVDVLLRIQKDSTQALSPNRDQIKAALTDIFIAGTDTSAATLVWTMSELIRHPTVLKRAQDEVRSVLGRKGKVEEGDLSRFNYLKLVVKEALRLHPPAPVLVPRETSKSCTIMGYRIPARTRVFVNARSIATDPKYWENPKDFQPERFFANPIDFMGQDFELLPFGAGRRGCPGINFAVGLIELVLANLLYHFDWKLPHGASVEQLDMEEAFGLTVHKKSPLYLLATTADACVKA